MTSLVSIQDLTVRFGTPRDPKLILDAVSLDIARGEAVGLVGESGSGKSTTARAIVRALPTAHVEGQILFDDQDINTLDGKALRELRSTKIAMIGQNPRSTMNPVRRVGDFATEALRSNRGISTTTARATLRSLLEEVGITSPDRVLDQYPHQLSGGMLQRVVIAAAIAAEPVLLIADEPTTALDVTTQAEVTGILADLLKGRDMAMLFITHNLDLASAVCDRTIVMYAGQIVEEQASARLLQHPQHPYTAGLREARTRVDVDIDRLLAIPGRPIAAFERGSGCPFAPRCAFAQERCHESMPPLEITNHGRVACYRHAEMPDLLKSAMASSSSTQPDSAPPDWTGQPA